MVHAGAWLENDDAMEVIAIGRISGSRAVIKYVAGRYCRIIDLMQWPQAGGV